MFKNKRNILVDQIRSITIEPVIFLHAIGLSIASGSQIGMNLLIWKICRVTLNYTQEVCDNLGNDTNEDAQIDVQEHVNRFEMYSQWIASVPIVCFSILAGALSDKFGRKPLIFWPMFGNLLAYLSNIINYIFIETLPLEFFYLEKLGAFFGGYAVYYLGTYSFGTNVTKQNERAYRLARLDGIEVLAVVLGTVCSSYVYEGLGYNGSFILACAFIVLAMIYLVVFIKEPMPLQETSKVKKSLGQLMMMAVKTPLEGIKSIVVKKRASGIKGLIILQLALFWSYWSTIVVMVLMYLYMLRIFDDFDGADYALFSVVCQLTTSFFLLVVMPVFNMWIKFHDAIILFIILAMETFSFMLTPSALELWQFYLIQIVGTIGLCKYSVVRSLLSRCIEADEVGRVFSVLAVVAALAPIAANPGFRELYNYTLEDHPGSFFYLAGGITALAALGNIFLYTKRHLMVNSESESKEEPIPTIDGEMVEIKL